MKYRPNWTKTECGGRAKPRPPFVQKTGHLKGALLGKVRVKGPLSKCREQTLKVGLARLDSDGVWRPFNLNHVGFQVTDYLSRPGDPTCGVYYASVLQWGAKVGGGTYHRGRKRKVC